MLHNLLHMYPAHLSHVKNKLSRWLVAHRHRSSTTRGQFTSFSCLFLASASSKCSAASLAFRNSSAVTSPTVRSYIGSEEDKMSNGQTRVHPEGSRPEPGTEYYRNTTAPDAVILCSAIRILISCLVILQQYLRAVEIVHGKYHWS